MFRPRRGEPTGSSDKILDTLVSTSERADGERETLSSGGNRISGLGQVEGDEVAFWFSIGTHSEYDSCCNRCRERTASKQPNRVRRASRECRLAV